MVVNRTTFRLHFLLQIIFLVTSLSVATALWAILYIRPKPILGLCMVPKNIDKWTRRLKKTVRESYERVKKHDKKRKES
jgi:hypothetical protein